MILHDRVILFCRYPVPGRTKTRLIPVLGRTGAAELQRRLTEETLSKVKRFARRYSAAVEVCSDGELKKVGRWLGPGVHLSRQPEGNLGSRMKAAFDRAFGNGCRRVVLHGADVPGMRGAHLEEAFGALSEHDLVLGPSTDGGYWLIGLSRSEDLFRGMAWGDDRVFRETLLRARERGLRTHLLEPLTDVDTPVQLREVLPGWDHARPYLSVIIPVLNEEGRIESAIRHAWNEDAEVLVVDGGSVDRTCARAASMGANVLRGPRGRGAQQNLGAGAAKGRVLLFLHADTRLPGDYMDHVFEVLQDPRVSAGAFRFRTDLRCPFMRMIEFTTWFRSSLMALPYGDQALFMRRSVFESTGGFREVPLGEDFYLVRILAGRGRIGISTASAVTSGRRWRELGLMRTTWINQVVGVGLLLGISPHTLARIYRRTERTT
jgi:rSAM/selenodomain-associated transferase 2/rSAM/selenodomain-associated transferase 1